MFAAALSPALRDSLTREIVYHEPVDRSKHLPVVRQARAGAPIGL